MSPFKAIPPRDYDNDVITVIKKCITKIKFSVWELRLRNYQKFSLHPNTFSQLITIKTLKKAFLCVKKIKIIIILKVRL